MDLKPDTFAGKVAVISGGTSGLGAATARLFAELGATVHAVGLGAEKVSFPADLPIEVHELDVADDTAVRAFFAQLSRLDVLVPAAGVTLGEPEQEPEGFRRVIDINLNAVQLFAHLGAPIMAKNGGGSIVTFASMMSTFGSAHGPAYSASKGAIVQFTKSLAHVHAPSGIRVNAVAPGSFATPMLESMIRETPEAAEAIIARTPLARFGEPSEIATAVAFLSSDLASFITGAVLPVDGGYLTM